MHVGFTLFFSTLAAACLAQDAPPMKVPEATFRVGTDLVLLNVSVFDSSGQLLKGLVQDFTSDLEVLERSVRNVRPQGGTAMRDAVLLGIDHMKAHAARDKRVLVVITDGEDNASMASRAALTEAARRNNVTIYAIGLLGEEQPSSAAMAREDLEELTQATGGRAWFPGSTRAIAAVTPEIAHEIRNQYIIGYKPLDLTKDGKFRTITVDVNVPGASVRTRPGYFARP